MNWETEFKTTHGVRVKLHDAEKRLKSPLYDILHRWVMVEGSSMVDMKRKLDTTHTVIDRLLDYFELRVQHELNTKHRKQLKPTF